jgi:CubicO group peptidase (beta-lactamase class C family)
MAVALAFGVDVEWGLVRYEQNAGLPGVTFASLLSHASGLGFEEGDPVRPMGERRVYSNCGIDRAVAAIVEDNPPANWLADRLFTPLGMASTALRGRPSAGVEGSTADMERLALAWLRPELISRESRDRIIRPYMPDLAGVVPGFGRFAPCPWGLGPEVRGTKEHWMGDWPSASFGHFGQSGALMLLNATEQIGVVAASAAPFGPWAVSLWPEWTSTVRRLALGSAA